MQRAKTAMISMAIVLVASIAASLPGVSASRGTATVDGQLDEGYTLVYNATRYNATFDVYQRNDASTYWFFLRMVGENDTFQSFVLEKPTLLVNVTGNTVMPGLYTFAFTTSRDGLEFAMTGYLVSSSFTFLVNNVSYTFPISAFPAPPPPPDDRVGPSKMMEFLANLFGAAGWPSVFFWVVVIIWFWRAATRKTWIVRKPGSVQGHELGRWIKEEEVLLGGTRYWRHTFKTDAAKTATVEQFYADHCKEELIGKTRFRQINGFWLAMPWIRVGTMKLRPDQWFPRKVEGKSPAAQFKKFLYYMLCWLPKVNDELYRNRDWQEAGEVVREIPFLYVTFAEDRVVDVYQTTWEEKRFDAETQREDWIVESKQMTKEEIAILRKMDDVRQITIGPVSFMVRSYQNLDDALNDKFSREELMATHRYITNELDARIEQLNTRLEGTITTLENERRQRTEALQEQMNAMNDHNTFIKQNMKHYIARAVGLKDLGLNTTDAIETVLKDAVTEYMKHSDAILKKRMLEQEAEVKKLQDQNKQLEIELKKRTRNDVDPAEVVVEHANTG